MRTLFAPEPISDASFLGPIDSAKFSMEQYQEDIFAFDKIGQALNTAIADLTTLSNINAAVLMRGTICPNAAQIAKISLETISRRTKYPLDSSLPSLEAYESIYTRQLATEQAGVKTISVIEHIFKLLITRLKELWERFMSFIKKAFVQRNAMESRAHNIKSRISKMKDDDFSTPRLMESVKLSKAYAQSGVKQITSSHVIEVTKNHVEWCTSINGLPAVFEKVFKDTETLLVSYKEHNDFEKFSQICDKYEKSMYEHGTEAAKQISFVVNKRFINGKTYEPDYENGSLELIVSEFEANDSPPIYTATRSVILTIVNEVLTLLKDVGKVNASADAVTEKANKLTEELESNLKTIRTEVGNDISQDNIRSESRETTEYERFFRKQLSTMGGISKDISRIYATTIHENIAAAKLGLDYCEACMNPRQRVLQLTHTLTNEE